MQNDRLRHMMLLLIWEGSLSRKRLIELFNLSGIRASEWLREFRDQQPSFSRWDDATKSHLPTSALYQWLKDTALDEAGTASLGLNQYLPLVRSLLSPDEWLVEGFPTLSSPSPAIFACLQRAIAKQQGVAITYVSMTRPEPHSRVLFPHSIICTGQRWHVRGYSPEHGEFRDHNIGRLLSAVAVSEISPITAAGDAKWHEKLPVHLIPHPMLPLHQAGVVQHEYFGGLSGRIDHIRAALVPYYLADKQVALDLDVQLPPSYLLAVANPEEVRPWMF